MHFLLAERKEKNLEKPVKPELEKLKKEEKRSYSSKEYNRYSNVPVLGALENKLKIILRAGLIKIFGIKFLNKIGKKLYNINERNS